jgi:cell division protein YceG involved in septum cleavage
MPATYKFKTQAAEATYKFVAAAVVDLEQEYENSRNSGAAVAKIVTGQSIVQKGTTYNGSAVSAESSAFLGGHILRRDV